MMGRRTMTSSVRRLVDQALENEGYGYDQATAFRMATKAIDASPGAISLAQRIFDAMPEDERRQTSAHRLVILQRQLSQAREIARHLRDQLEQARVDLQEIVDRLPRGVRL